jgi:stress response protein YsnF
MPDDVKIIPIVEEEAVIRKRLVDVERVTVRTSADTERLTVQEDLYREDVEVTRVSIEREVAEAPAVRIEGDVTIVPIVEERLVLSKRLFLVEELHLRRSGSVERVDVPVELRRTRVDINRADISGDERRR